MWKPKKIFLVDSEIWPNLILSSKEMKIPISYKGRKDGKKKKFAKTTLIKKITSKYLIKQKEKSKKKLKK